MLCKKSAKPAQAKNPQNDDSPVALTWPRTIFKLKHNIYTQLKKIPQMVRNFIKNISPDPDFADHEIAVKVTKTAGGSIL
jgi:hypothetical protein